MRARIIDYLFVRSGQGRLILELDEDFRNDYEEMKDCDVDVNIKKYFPSRSKDANAYAWVLLNKIAQKMNESKVDVYRRYVRNYGKVTVSCVKNSDMETEIRTFLDGHVGRMVDIGDSKIPDCVVIFKRYGSSSFDSKEMGLFLDAIIEDCKDLHIDTKPKEYINSLLEEWDGRRKEKES